MTPAAIPEHFGVARLWPQPDGASAFADLPSACQATLALCLA